MTMSNLTQDQLADDAELEFLTTEELCKKIAMSVTTLHRRRHDDPTFPRPVVFTAGNGRHRSIRWVKHEVEEWMQRKMARRGE